MTDLPGRLAALVRSTPWLLEDLFGLVCRRNPRRVTVDHYRYRVHDKRIAERWPRVQIIGS